MHRVTDRRPGQRLAVLSLLALLAVQVTAGAAPLVHADPTGLCDGESPCYTTVQEAVDNAGPAPATVLIFPGLYPESVDLSAMGSAIAGSPGDLTLRAVDATGAPALAGVEIAAPGGFALGTSVPFPGAVSVLGLALTSPDSSGLQLGLTGDALLDHLVLANCGAFGGAVFGQGAVTATAIQALSNTDSGLLLAGAAVDAEDILVSGNGGDGFAADSEGPLGLRQVLATDNVEVGIRGRSCEELTAEDLTAAANARGAELLVDPSSCLAAPSTAPSTMSGLAGRWPSRREDSLGDLEDGAELRRRFAPSSHAGSATVTSLAVSDNDDLGAAVAGPAAVVVSGVTALRNGMAGLIVFAGQAHVVDGTFEENGGGLALVADSVDVSGVLASDNVTPAVPSSLADGSGIVLALTGSGGAAFDGVVAERNDFAGMVLLTEPVGTVRGPVAVTDGRFADNVVGIATEGDGTVMLQLTDVETTGNSVAGLSLPDLEGGLFQRLLVQGNGEGIAAAVAGNLQILQSEVGQNVGSGLLFHVAPGASAAVRCSNIRDNPDAGLELLSGDAIDARRNFWGAASGPTHPGNPGGSGDEVIDGANGGAGVVDYSGFLSEPATLAACQLAVTEIPTTGELGLALLAVLLAVLGLAVLRRSSPVG